jgi:hypothetical protein
MAGSMTGEQIQALADALEPLSPKDLGPAVQGFAVAFGITSVIVVCLRIHVRAGLSGVSPRLLGFEDYLAVLATVSSRIRRLHRFELTNFSKDTLNTRRRFRLPFSALRSRIPRCEYSESDVPYSRHRVPNLLGAFILYFVDNHQVRHRFHMYTPRSSEASCLSHMRQYVGYDHRHGFGSSIRVCQLQAFSCDVEPGFVSLLTPGDIYHQLT